MSRIPETGLCILLEKGAFNTLRFSCYQDQKRVSAASSLMPSALRSIARRAFSYESIDRDLIDALNEIDEEFVLALNNGARFHTYEPVEVYAWDPKFVATPRILLQQTDQCIRLSKCVVSNGIVLDQVEFLGQSFVIDRESKRVGYVQDIQAWEVWDGLKNAPGAKLVKDESLEINSEYMRINGYFFDYQMDENPFVFSDGNSVQIYNAQTLTLMVSDDLDGQLLQLGYFLNGSFVLSAIHSLTRKTVADKSIEDGVAAFFATETGLILCPIDLKREVEAMLLLDRVFDQKSKLKLPYDPLFVSKKSFQTEVKSLKELFKSTLDIDLFYLDKPLEFVSLSAHIDIQKNAENEYQIIPKFQVSDQQYIGLDWISLFQNQDIQSSDGKALMLSDEDSQILRHLLTVRNKYQSENKDEETDENNKDAVILHSKLQLLDWLMLKKEGVNISLPKEEERIWQRLLHFEELPKYAIPKGLNCELRDYQEFGYRWLGFLYECRFGACLADDMGLGKTIQTIALLVALHEGDIECRSKVKVPHLIIVPPSLIYNWKKEIQKFSSLKVDILSARHVAEMSENPDVIVSTYDYVRRNLADFDDKVFDVLVFDEAQYVKNLTAARTVAVQKLNANFTITLTGTPLENHLGEYYSILNLAVPGIFGPYKVFLQAVKDEDVRPILNRSKPFVLRRRKSEILTQLPPKVERDEYLSLSENQAALYREIQLETRKIVKDSYSKLNAGQARVRVLTAITRMRQICVCPALLDPSFERMSPKVERILDLAETLLDEDSSFLIFSQFRSFLDILEPFFIERKLPYLRMDGSTSAMKRDKLVETFQNSKGNHAFLMSLKTGGVGLNLTRANYVIHSDPWWNPAVENQASDRAHRIGQTESVFVDRLIMSGTIEEKLMEMKQKKVALFESVFNHDHQVGYSIGREDFEFLLSD